MICDKCLHADVCGEEGAFDPALTYCADFLGWVSVSEGLPKEREEVLVSSYDTYGKKTIIARYQGKEYGFTCGLVKAWMPLPKPYKAESEDSAKIDCSKTKCENCTNHNYCDYEINNRQESEGKE